MKRYALSKIVGGRYKAIILKQLIKPLVDVKSLGKTQGYKKEDKDISNSFQHYCVKGIIHLKTKGELYPLLDANNKYIKCEENK